MRMSDAAASRSTVWGPAVWGPAVWGPVPASWRPLVRATLVAVVSVASMVAASYVVRRLSGGGAEWVATWPGLMGGSLGLATLAAAQRSLWLVSLSPPSADRSSAVELLIGSAPSVCVWLGLGFLLSLSPSVWFALLLVAPALVEEVWALRWLRRVASGPRGTSEPGSVLGSGSGAPSDETAGPTDHRSTAESTAASVLPAADEVLESDEEAVDEEELAEWGPPGVFQQFTRGVDAQGEYVVGIMHVDLEPGQRGETLHVAFCPPLAVAPRIVVRPIDGPPATASVGQSEVFGARFDVRLGRAWEEPQRVVIQFEARATERVSEL